MFLHRFAFQLHSQLSPASAPVAPVAVYYQRGDDTMHTRLLVAQQSDALIQLAQQRLQEQRRAVGRGGFLQEFGHGTQAYQVYVMIRG